MKNMIIFKPENIAFHLTSDILSINGAQSPTAEKFYRTVEYTAHQITAEFITLFRDFIIRHKSDFYANAPNGIDQIPTDLITDIFTEYLTAK
jgi:hypothetical protein